MNCKPYLTLCIEYTAKVAPSHSEIGLCLNSFQVASLQNVQAKRTGRQQKRVNMTEVPKSGASRSAA